jgi:hypothetical protein
MSLKKGTQEIVLQETVDDEEIAKCLLEGAYHLPGNNYAYVYIESDQQCAHL